MIIPRFTFASARHWIALTGAIALASCAGSKALTPSQSLYAAFSGYRIALATAADYAESPTADRQIVGRLNAANQSQAAKDAVRYAEAYVRCRGAATTVVAGVDCSIWDFKPQTVSAYAITLRSVTSALLVRGN